MYFNDTSKLEKESVFKISHCCESLNLLIFSSKSFSAYCRQHMLHDPVGDKKMCAKGDRLKERTTI